MSTSQPRLVLQWHPEHSVGVAQLDNEHQKFFRLMRNLYDAMKMAANKTVIGALLGELYAYSATHMTHEEEILQKNNYPELEEHRREHLLFRERIRTYMDEFDSRHGTISLSLLQFLQEWLGNHIVTVDQRYVEFLRSKGVR